MTAPIVEIETLTRRFGAFAAVDSLTLTANAGEVFGLPGSPGAGKSTIIMPAGLKVISPLNPLTCVVDAFRTSMLAGSASTFGLSMDYAAILSTTIILVLIGACLYPQLGV